jgi:Ca2+-binding EF-hand superfamily protein
MTISSYSSIGMMPPVSNISKDIVAQNDKNSDSSLSIEELGIDEEQFSTLDSDGDGLVTQNEIASAIDSKLSSFDGQMPSKEEFETLISELGLQMPEPPVSPQANDFSSMIMSSYDTDSDSLLSSSEASILSEEEFSALDTNSDGSISTDELSSAYDKVTSSSESSETMASMPPPSGGASSSSSEDEYDELDTNKDGIVSQEEKNAALGISSEDTISSSSTSNEDVKNTLKMLLDTIKLNAQNSSENIDLSSFKNIMQMMNNQTNNSELNSYVKNLSNSNSSLLNYA